MRGVSVAVTRFRHSHSPPRPQVSPPPHSMSKRRPGHRLGDYRRRAHDSPTRSPSPAAPASHGHPIPVVARRTGLSADVIRAWEKRYAVVTPARTAAGRRLYSDADVERLALVARATLTGRTVGQVAALPPRNPTVRETRGSAAR